MKKSNPLEINPINQIPTTDLFRNLQRKPLLILSTLLCLFFANYTSAQVSLTATVGTTVGNFTTLKGAFDAINAGTHRGVISITVTSNTTETATAALNASGSGSALYTAVSIQPSGGGARTIAGAIAAGSALISLNGADNVTINGLNSGGNSLTIQNTTASATAGTATILLINGATSNTITNTNLQGSFSGGVDVNGGTVYFATDALTANGNDNNMVSFNNIGPAGSNLSSKGIYMTGSTSTTAIGNSGNTLNGNNIFDHFRAAGSSSGIYITDGTVDNSVTNNKFYQTASRAQTTSEMHSAICINTTSGNSFTVTGNTIGYASSTATGTYTITGSPVVMPIYIRTGNTCTVDVSGNTITNMAVSGNLSIGTSVHYAIAVSAGIATCNNNAIGSQSIAGAITYTSNSLFALEISAISVYGVSSITVNNNTIGGITASNSSTGVLSFNGINGGANQTTTLSTISGNTLTNMAVSGNLSGPACTAIYQWGGVGICNSNVIGSQSATDAITFTSNSLASSTVYAIGNTCDSIRTLNNNTIGAITSSNISTGGANLCGIGLINANANTGACYNNIIGGTAANSLRASTTNTANVVIGIYGLIKAGNITSNTVRNITTVSGVGSGISAGVSGITFSNNTSTIVIGSNIIYNLKNTYAGAATVNGIVCNGLLTSTVEKNLIYGLDASNAAAVINGIMITNGTSTLRNNMIRLGTSGSSATIGFQINGIYELAGVNSLYFNSVYMGGAPTSGSASSFGFRSLITLNTRIYQNNIFYNARSNNGSTGKHYAIAVGGILANPVGLTSNYNILLASGTGGNVGLYNGTDRSTLALWRTATGQDANSQNADPLFIAPTAATPDLHIQTSVPSPADATGTAIAGITDDFDGSARAGLTPVDIGADAFTLIPTITSFTPGLLCLAGGQTVTITGTNFVNVTAVRFNGVDAVSYIVVNTTTITAVTPLSLAPGNVTVTTAGGTATSPTAYINTAFPASVQTAIGMALVTSDYLWNGNVTTEWTNAANWYVYNGTDFVTTVNIPVNTSRVFILPPTTLGICVNATNSTVVSAAGVANNVYIGTSATITINAGQNLDVYGDWTNNGIFTPNATGTVSLRGTNTQSIGGNSANNFTNLVLNKTGGSATLVKPATVTGTLTMTNGIFNTTATNLLTVGTAPAAPGNLSWTDGTIVGPLKRFYATTLNASQAAGIFPVGNAAYNRYARVNFTADPGGGFITAEYKSGACPVGYNGLVATINGQFINNYENEGYWEITPNGGNLNTTNYTLILRGNRLTTVNNLSKLRIIKSSNHTAWNDNPAGDGDHVPASASVTDFTIGATSMRGFSWFNIGSDNSNPLPVELTHFSANCDAASEVILQWSTASEHNSQKFILEKSREMDHWIAFDNVAAAVNSNYKIDYTLTDRNPSGGISYYRLVQVDIDGHEQVYGPISVSCKNHSNTITVFPNPAKNQFTVEVVSTEAISIADMRITDLSGQIISSRSIQLTQGTNQFFFDDENLQAGTYLVSLIAEKNSFNPVRIVLNDE